MGPPGCQAEDQRSDAVRPSSSGPAGPAVSGVPSSGYTPGTGRLLCRTRITVGGTPAPAFQPRISADVALPITSWFCLECGAVVYGPPVGASCRVLAGPAAVR